MLTIMTPNSFGFIRWNSFGFPFSPITTVCEEGLSPGGADFAKADTGKKAAREEPLGKPYPSKMEILGTSSVMMPCNTIPHLDDDVVQQYKY